MFSGYTYRNLVCVPAAPVSGGTSHALASKHLLLFPFRRLFSPLHSFVSCCCCCCRVRPSHLANLINLFGMTCSRFYDRADKAQLAAAAIERERGRERNNRRKRVGNTLPDPNRNNRRENGRDAQHFESKSIPPQLHSSRTDWNKTWKRNGPTPRRRAEELVKLSKRNKINIF